MDSIGGKIKNIAEAIANDANNYLRKTNENLMFIEAIAIHLRNIVPSFDHDRFMHAAGFGKYYLIAGCHGKPEKKGIGADVELLPITIKANRIELKVLPVGFVVKGKKKRIILEPISFAQSFDKSIWATITDDNGKIFHVHEHDYLILRSK